MSEQLTAKPKTKQYFSWTVIILALVGFFGIAVWLNTAVRTEQQFSFLAQSFLHGHLGFTEPPGIGWEDTTPHGSGHYWPLGPFPAVLLIPFQFVSGLAGQFFYQGYLQIFLVAVLLFFVFRVARLTGFNREDGAYLAFGFVFSTAFLGVALWPWSWYFSQVITCVLLFAAIWEMITKRRPLLIGSLFAFCLATRATAALGVIWFAGEIIREQRSTSEKMRTLATAAAPLVVVSVLLLIYNYARFGNAFDQGYADQIVPEFAAKARSVGIFSIHHLPANLYALLFAGPVPILREDSGFVLRFPFLAANPWGMSMFVTAPCFFLLPSLAYRDATSRLILVTIAVIALPILVYYGVGYRQFGYRYSLDFLPLLFYLLFRNYQLQRGHLSVAFKFLIVASAIWNLNLFAGHFLWHLT